MRRSQVFIVRTWTEERGEERGKEVLELRGMVRDVHSGETQYFRTWTELLNFVASHGDAVQGLASPDLVSHDGQERRNSHPKELPGPDQDPNVGHDLGHDLCDNPDTSPDGGISA